jgi:hypothetical protein
MALAGLTPDIINAITRDLSVGPDGERTQIRDITRAELRNFLHGRITTVTDESEFAEALRGITQDIESGMTFEKGVATGEIVGALEGGALVGLAGGGIIFGKGLEIVGQFQDILTGTDAETRARQTQSDFTNRLAERGMIHGGLGNPTRDPFELIAQMRSQQERERAKAGEFKEDERKFSNTDPDFQSRPSVTDTFPETEQPSRITRTSAGRAEAARIRGEVAREEARIAAERAAARVRGAATAAEAAANTAAATATAAAIAAAAGIGILGSLDEGKEGGRRPDVRQPDDPIPPKTPKPPVLPNPRHRDQKTPSVVNRVPVVPPSKNSTQNDETDTFDTPEGNPMLRPSFKHAGTEFINKLLNTPMAVENSEWSDFDFVSLVDSQNGIEVNNLLGELIRFQDPLFIPKFQPPVKPPSAAAVSITHAPMINEIQLTQQFMPKFDDADMGQPMQLTETYNKSMISADFLNLRLYNPI